MKKLLSLILLLFTLTAYPQQGDKSENFNRILFAAVKQIPLKSSVQKPAIYDALDEILLKTKDSLLIERIENYRKDISNLEFSNEVNVDFTKIEKKDLRKYQVIEDQFNQITFIYSEIPFTKSVYPYIGIKDGIMFLRLKTYYSDDNWIFMDEAIFLVDGEKFTYDLGEVNREVRSGGGVYEVSDIMVDDYLLSMIHAIQNSKSEVSYRLTGKYRYDSKLSKQAIKKINHIMELYNNLLKTGK